MALNSARDAVRNTARVYRIATQGDADIGRSIRTSLDALKAKEPAALRPTTVLFVEIPTNPDMKVPDLDDVVKYVNEYKAATGKRAVLVIDTTFAPSSGVMAKVYHYPTIHIP